MKTKKSNQDEIKERIGVRYDPTVVEPKWQAVWEEKKTFRVDIENAKKPYYNLSMFPYPSAEGLHVGHIIPYSGSDTFGRYMRMKGFEVFEPMGFDAFGIHSENFAIKKGIHPATLTAQTTKYFKDEQMKKLGTMFDWERMVDTSNPNYYKWTQWLFVQMFKAGLAVRKKALVNWCPSCKTVLSDEQVVKKSTTSSTGTTSTTGIDVCERCKTEVERKEMEQWFFRITKYAERLLSGTDKINWSQKTLTAQRNWIGKSEGLYFRAPVKGKDLYIETFSAHFEAFYADTFVVIAPDHPRLSELLEGQSNKDEVSKFCKTLLSKREYDKPGEEKEPEGIFTGLYIVDPVGKGDLPIWVASYALKDYGTGIVKCSAHDERDFAFAKKYKIRLKTVLYPDNSEERKKVENQEICYTDMVNGILSEPAEFAGKRAREVREEVIAYAEAKGLAKRETMYKLRDWCISRQRYWGPPIPMIFCKKCGWQPVPEDQLPVLLPDTKDYLPDGSGKSPLAKIPSFVKTKCPNCGGAAERETDVSDTFLDSAWYFLRYPSVEIPKNKSQNPPKNSYLLARSTSLPRRSESSGQANKFQISNFKFQIPWDPQITRQWLPVDMYIGGNEHAVLHLMYSRFVTMVLHDLGYLTFDEPFTRFFAHGLMIKDGAKMSKSRGNVVNPDLYLKKYGADALRMYVLFLGPYDAGGDFRDSGMEGMTRFLNRIYRWGMEIIKSKNLSNPSGQSPTGGASNPSNPSNSSDLYRQLQKLIKSVGEDLENLKFNTAIAKMMEFLNEITNFQHPTSNQIQNSNFQKTKLNQLDQLDKSTSSLRATPAVGGVNSGSEVYPAPNGAGAICLEILEKYLLLLAPLAPHLAEELFQELQKSKGITDFISVHDQPWPEYDPKALTGDEVTIVVQVNGKVRDVVTVGAGLPAQAGSSRPQKDEIISLAQKSEKIQKYLSGKKIINIIYVPLKLMNFVVE